MEAIENYFLLDYMKSFKKKQELSFTHFFYIYFMIFESNCHS